MLVSAASLFVTACLTTTSEQKMGDEAAQQVIETMGLVSESELTRWVRAVCERLAAQSERPEGPWSFHVVDTPDPNAFALPGGHVYVTRGLLALVNSEDELAGVMGHEIAHVTHRHSSKRIGAAVATSPITIATGIAGFATSIVSPSLGNAVAGSGQLLTKGLVLAPYSRSQETEADEVGQTLAARAGYDPGGLPRFLHTLDREVDRLTGGESGPGFLSDHPMTPDRVAKTEERAKTLERAPGKPIASHAELLAHLDGLIFGPDPAQGVFLEELFLHPTFDFAVRFPAGWSTVNNPSVAGARSPEGDAIVALQLVDSGTTLDAVLAKLREQTPDVAVRRSEIGGLPAARVEVDQRRARIVITWIELRGDVFAIYGQTGATKSFDASFESAANSFRPITRKEKASIDALRLRLRTAGDSETPAAIARRTDSAWDAAQLAIANGVADGGHFASGATVKVVLREPWSSDGR